jgi:hypothetical protein
LICFTTAASCQLITVFFHAGRFLLPFLGRRLAGKLVQLAIYFMLMALAVPHEKTQQALMQEALNLLFAKYGKDQIS